MTHEEMIASGQHECASDCSPLMTQPLRPQAEPRTARWYGMTPGEAIGAITRGEYVLVRAAEQSVPLDVEALARALVNAGDTPKIRGWGKDRLNMQVEVARTRARVIAAEYARLVDGAQAPTVKSVPLSDEGQANRNARLATMHPTFLEDGAQATPQPATTWRIDPSTDLARPTLARPAAHPAGSADTALPLGSTSNGALDNAQGPNQLQGNVATPTQSADTALERLARYVLGYQEDDPEEVLAAARAALAAQPTSAARPKGSEEDS